MDIFIFSRELFTTNVFLKKMIRVSCPLSNTFSGFYSKIE